jgi:hypothetical protein
VILNSMTFDWMARRIISGLHLNKFTLAYLRWPKLQAEDIDRLSDIGSLVAGSLPRGGLRSAAQPANDAERIEAMAEAEIIIARLFGLAFKDVSFMLDDTPTDRRGFWRYFDSVDEGRKIRARVLDRLGKLEQLAA